MHIHTPTKAERDEHQAKVDKEMMILFYEMKEAQDKKDAENKAYEDEVMREKAENDYLKYGTEYYRAEIDIGDYYNE